MLLLYVYCVCPLGGSEDHFSLPRVVGAGFACGGTDGLQGQYLCSEVSQAACGQGMAGTPGRGLLLYVVSTVLQ